MVTLETKAANNWVTQHIKYAALLPDKTDDKNRETYPTKHEISILEAAEYAPALRGERMVQVKVTQDLSFVVFCLILFVRGRVFLSTV